MSTNPKTREQVLADMLNLVKDMIRDFDLDLDGGVQPSSFFVADLDFQSTDVVELIVQIEKLYQRRKLPFQKLVLKNGRYADFTVGELADFLHQQLSAPSA